MSKGMAVFVALVVGAVAYLAFDPRAARDVSNWVNRQVGRTPNIPSGKQMGTPGYMPVVPGSGL
jgi:hypothetical protein